MIMDIAIENKDLEEFQKKTVMSLSDCIKILVNSVKYGGKFEFDTFWSDENISELNRRIDDAKKGKNMVEHKLIEVDWWKFFGMKELGQNIWVGRSKIKKKWWNNWGFGM